MTNGKVLVVTDIHLVLTAIVAAVKAGVTYPVYDGPPTSLPSKTTSQFVAIGCDTLEGLNEETAPPVDSAEMEQSWKGLGQVSRGETMRVNCVAVGRADTVANARGLAIGVVTDVGQNVPVHPTSSSYNALLAEVISVKAKPTSGGAFVHVQFVITAQAQLY